MKIEQKSSSSNFSRQEEVKGRERITSLPLSSSRDLRRLLRKGDLREKRIAWTGKAAKASEGRSSKSGVWLSFQSSSNLEHSKSKQSE